MEAYTVVEKNPNDAIGGGGCACSDSAHRAQEGPFVVFHNTETDNNLSPHVVICAHCIDSAACALAPKVWIDNLDPEDS